MLIWKIKEIYTFSECFKIGTYFRFTKSIFLLNY